MKKSTSIRHERIRQAAKQFYGKMPVMHLYTKLALDFGYSEENIRKILAKKPKKHPP
jgi:hypothetical protein